MRIFSYKRQIDPFQNIFTKEKKRVNIQRWIYISIFCVLLVSLAIYLSLNIFYVHLDGVITSPNYRYRLMEDVVITDVYVKPGDKVEAGDILFSYIPTKAILSSNNDIEYSWIDKEVLSIEKEVEESNIQKKHIKNQIIRLEQEYTNTRNKAFVGVATENELYRIEKEVNEYKLQQQILNSQIEMNDLYLEKLKRNKSIIRETFQNPGEKAYGKISELTERAVKNYVASFDGDVVNVNFQSWENVFKEENVVEIRPASVQSSDLHVLAYVRMSDVRDLQTSDTVLIQWGNILNKKGVVDLYMLNSAPLPKELRRPFETEKEVMVVRINILDMESIPVDLRINGIAVQIQKSRFKKQK
ncbi:MAG: hypothetical protein RR333_06505 [Bacteroidales bacterium]